MRVAEIGELAHLALTAKRTLNTHGLAGGGLRKSVQVGLGAHALLVEEMAGREAVQSIGARQLMRLIACQQVRETPAGGRRCLETAITPPGVEIQTFDRCTVDDR